MRGRAYLQALTGLLFLAASAWLGVWLYGLLS